MSGAAARRFQPATLRGALVLYSSLLIVCAVAVTALVFYAGATRSVDLLVTAVQRAGLEGVAQQLEEFLAVPFRVNAANLGTARQGFWDPDDPAEALRYLWTQGRVHPGLGTIAYSNPQGEFYGANPVEEYVVLADREVTGGAIRKFRPGPDGAPRGTPLADKPGYDARSRSWYRTAVAAGKATWTEIDLSVTTARLDLSAVTPYYGPDGGFRGVFLVDLSLDQINRFLARWQADRGGTLFIVDRDGLLVGASSPEAFHPRGGGRIVDRVAAVDSDDPVVARAARRILEGWGGFAGVASFATGRFQLDGERQYLAALPYGNNGAIDWVIVQAISEQSVAGPIRSSTRLAVALGAVVLGLAVLGAVLIAGGATRPLTELNRAARLLADGQWGEPVRVARRDEVGELARSFNRMAAQLQSSVDQLRREVALREQQAEQLAASEGRQRAMLDAVPDLLFITSAEGVFLDVRANDPQQLLVAPEELRGRHVRDVLPPHLAALLLERAAQAARSRETQTYEYRLELGDEERHYEARSVPYGEGGAMTLCRDITRRVQAQREREDLERRLARAQQLESLGTLAGGVAHEFNNLLQIISGHTELLKVQADASGFSSPALQVIEHAGRRAEELVKGLLAFARQRPPTKVPVDLSEVVQRTCRILRSTTPRMIALETTLEPDPWPVLADAGQVEQVLLNLASNAADAMPEGGTLRITTENIVADREFVRAHRGARSGARFVEIAVADTGAGMDPDTARNIFDPFFTTKEVGRGTGLGLSVVHGIVQDHDGHIDVVSSPGGGTEVRVFLPVCEETGAASGPAPDEVPAAVAGSGTVLVVDDEAEVRDLLVRTLRESGFETLEADSGERCLELLREGAVAVDLVILDLGMPGMGGRAALEEIRRLGLAVPVVVASGYPEADGAFHGLASGYLEKPYRIAEILGLVARVLRSA